MQPDDDEAQAPLHPAREDLGVLGAVAAAVKRFVRPAPPESPHGSIRGKVKAAAKAVAPYPVDD